jgi:hypothetical protein
MTDDATTDALRTQYEQAAQLGQGQPPRVLVDEHDIATVVSHGDIVVTRIEARTIVEEAPDRALITLGLLAHSAPDRLTVAASTLYLGNDRSGREASYQVTGWDPDQHALIVERINP